MSPLCTHTQVGSKSDESVQVDTHCTNSLLTWGFVQNCVSIVHVYFTFMFSSRSKVYTGSGIIRPSAEGTAFFKFHRVSLFLSLFISLYLYSDPTHNALSIDFFVQTSENQFVQYTCSVHCKHFPTCSGGCNCTLARPSYYFVLPLLMYL